MQGQSIEENNGGPSPEVPGPQANEQGNGRRNDATDNSGEAHGESIAFQQDSAANIFKADDTVREGDITNNMDVSGAALLLPAKEENVQKTKKTVSFPENVAANSGKSTPSGNINILLPQGPQEVNTGKRALKPFSSRRMQNYDAAQSSDSGGEENDGEEEPASTVVDTQGNTVVAKGNSRFKNYNGVFQDLVKSTNVATMYPIVQVFISYDSTRAITVTKASEQEYYVKMYDLETYELTFEECVKGRYIKLKDVEQAADGKKFAIVYNDDGKFYLRTFYKAPKQRSDEEIAEDQLDINAILGINDYTICNMSFPEPFATCTYISHDRIFVDVFYNYALTHYHFIYNLKDRAVEGEVQTVVLDCTRKNFPYKCFYNDERDEIYSFYRQGQAFIIDANDSSKFSLDRMTDRDLGLMFLVYNKALIARSSSDVLFFKIEVNEDTLERTWQQYDIIENMRGLVYYIKGNVRFQITTDEKIYFYKIDRDECKATLDNVMSNYMGCNQLMFGSKVKYGISYKSNQRSFDIYRRRYTHDFKVPISTANLEGAFGMELETMHSFLVAHQGSLLMYDSTHFKKLDAVPIKLLETDTREPNQIIAMQKCQDEQFLAIITGKILIMNEQKTNQLFIFKRVKSLTGELDKFEFDHRVLLKEIPFFTRVCMEYQFKNDGAKDTLLFCKVDQIFEFNFRTQAITKVVAFESELAAQPQFFKMDDAQEIFLVASASDAVFVNTRPEHLKKIRASGGAHVTGQVDLDAFCPIEAIRQTVYDPDGQRFFVVCNKYEEKLGFFIFIVNEDDPAPAEPPFLVKWKNKLDIGDCSVQILENHKTGIKELIITYKTIFVNTYTTMVMDISVITGQPSMIFRHESFQLWESECQGFFLNDSKYQDYISLSKAGMEVLSLGYNDKRAIVDHNGADRMIHSLNSVNFLKLEPGNYLLLECAYSDRRKVIVQEEYQKEIGTNSETGKPITETAFWPLYTVVFHDITLRELLLFNSLYVCKTVSQIVDVVNDQPNPLVFYKSFLELNGTNMTSILSFDSRSMSYLLGDEFSSYFSKEYPLIYRNKIQKGKAKKNQECKFFYRSAIDSALKCNQVKAVETIMQYVVDYQNHFISSYLFNKNLPDLIDVGIPVTNLFKSQIFQFNLDLDEWPQTHDSEEECLRYFNESIFQIRQHYRKVFPEKEFAPLDIDDMANKKIYKIKYKVNLLPLIGAYYYKFDDPYTKEKIREVNNDDINLLGTCTESDELELFSAEAIQELIEFKWQAFGYSFHRFGLIYHLCYIGILVAYTYLVYIYPLDFEDADCADDDTKCIETTYRKPKLNQSLSFALLAGIAYPMCYELVQMYKAGFTDYFGDLGNYVDLVYIFGSLVMTILHMTLQKGAYDWPSKLLMLLVVTLAIRRTFNYLRIFSALSPIVTMINKVVFDLNTFMLFYLILCVLFSLMWGILGLGNPQEEGSFQDDWGRCVGYSEDISQQAAKDSTYKIDYECTTWDLKFLGETPDVLGELPGAEYYYLGQLAANLLNTVRMSIGDYANLPAAASLTYTSNIVFWFIWLLTVIVTCVIFLNFIVAEASNSYNEVSEYLEEFIQKQKADLTQEAEEVYPEQLKEEKKFPKYIIIRQIDD